MDEVWQHVTHRGHVMLQLWLKMYSSKIPCLRPRPRTRLDDSGRLQAQVTVSKTPILLVRPWTSVFRDSLFRFSYLPAHNIPDLTQLSASAQTGAGRQQGAVRRRPASAAWLTVNADVDLAFVVTSFRVHLSSARVLAVISLRDVSDAQSVSLVELVPAAGCNNDVTHVKYLTPSTEATLPPEKGPTLDKTTSHHNQVWYTRV